ncbi:nicotinate-nucleotide--dimethylbenzimidazole phosphoribosyltransferase [Pseudonocardia sp. WMMC193]|uniref:nicotinate-nucleotide--dimethylbenzimidazole phosphoribosyltransferase n=1 Tax=Pseudonocardia sp. WMMC193 TaxID=2911965 RepID=UPI001F26ED46|nr:nicotinate-nucleotide--dimethylbenzimidazole phosphoribosyltransferase [Pseudonocardia sp. WMMC193]MCF7548140.1 nicotinate-nucleotide--dimethylbenzimidazole phosphoribosyltransferase [Pseudonocardia sp. WMMC193]
MSESPESPTPTEPAPFPPVPAPDLEARHQAVARLDGLAIPAGSLGVLADLGLWLTSLQGRCPPRPPARARVVVVAADHGIAAAGVSAYAADVTALQVAATLEQSAPVAVTATVAGASVRVIDAGLDRDAVLPGQDRYRVRRGSGRIDREDALSDTEVAEGIRIGRALADEEVDSGADLLVPASLGVGATTAASTLVAAVTGAEPVAVVGRGSGIGDDAWMRKAAAIRDALRRAKPHVRDPRALLRTIGGADLAVLTGFLVQAALRRTPVLLDGLVVGAAGLLADDLAPGAHQWWLAAQQSPEPAMTLVLQHLQLVPVLDLQIRQGDGTGAVAVLPLVQAAARLLGETASAESSGIVPVRAVTG